jgi:hypothetical protein
MPMPHSSGVAHQPADESEQLLQRAEVRAGAAHDVLDPSRQSMLPEVAGRAELHDERAIGRERVACERCTGLAMNAGLEWTDRPGQSYGSGSISVRSGHSRFATAFAFL